MAQLYGREWTKDELRRHSGQMSQLAGVTRYRLQEGFEQDVEICDIRTGSGFRFCVAPSRGMDIVFAEYNGRPLCWNSSTGVIHPAYFTEYNWGWLRGFYGGLLTTCGFQSFSIWCDDKGEHYGLHDRASYLPAREVQTSAAWVKDGADEVYEISCTGAMRETRVFGPNLAWKRRVYARLGENKFYVHDRLENEGFEPVPWLILYHCNFGFPVVSQHSTVSAPSLKRDARDPFTRETEPTWNKFEPPTAGIAERCYFHDMEADADGYVKASIHNAQLNFGGYLRYKLAELPDFTQWKMTGAGTYVCGLEPSNVPLKSRAQLIEENALPYLEPGEVKEITVELGVLDTP